MVPYGADESFESGREAYWRYRSLVNTSLLPFIRSDASQRDVDSAFNWTAGFSVASQHKLVPTVSLIMDAAARNNTLDGSQCPAAGRGEEQKSLLCPFETLAYRRKSPWCILFESIPGAFEAFEYTGDLDNFSFVIVCKSSATLRRADTGELGSVQGVGYINELLARLAGLPVQTTRKRTTHLTTTPHVPLNRTVYDQVQPLEFCDADEDGSYARKDGEGDWEKCFE
ncbi:hypothetical protein BC629DRAFT_1562187 [Irpex lacteus]|nr:hypothetical protein BC629DRAFT_1562187 [Irpex lacteus]